MNISFNWLKDFLDFDQSIEEVEKLLTSSGLEVENIDEIESVRGGLAGLVIGEIVEKLTHPNADKLSLTKVNIGNNILLPIVCGAPNVNKGQKVVVATVGCTLYPSSGEPFKIKKSKIRGEVSEGMICAEDEIGLGSNHEGIMVLDDSANVGALAKDYFNISSDYLIEIGLTPNRADAMSHYGVARDLQAVLKSRNLVGDQNKLKLHSVEGYAKDNDDLIIDVEVQDFDACPRYAGVTISNVKVKESPDWLKQKLTSIGLTPINNIVDITNYVLHDVGQPLHAFDANVVGKKVIVKQLPDKTKFTTLDEVERELSEKDLMICNEQTGMCIAGVFGGMKSGVSEKTTSIFLESAYFNPVTVRKTAKRHGLNTDASFRFERGIDPNSTVYALKRAALLIKELAGGKISSDIIDLYPKKIEDFEVKINYKSIERLLGQHISTKEIRNILSSLDIEILSSNDEGAVLKVQAFRNDVTREVDIAEEILRLYGYDNIEIPQKINASPSYSKAVDNEVVTNLIADLLVSNGYNEIMANSLTSSSNSKDSNLYQTKTDVVIENPLSSELNILRHSLIYNALEAVSRNQKFKNFDIQYFEFGKSYHRYEKFQESRNLTLTITGNQSIENWNTSSNPSDFYMLKGVLDLIWNRIGLASMNVRYSEFSDELFSYGLECKINKRKIAKLGKIINTQTKKFDVKGEVFIAEINWDLLLELVSLVKVKFKEISKYPTVRRDLAVLVNKQISFEELREAAKKNGKSILKKIGIFDIYVGKNLPENKKSYALKYIFQDDNRTLTDKDVDKVMNNIISTYQKQFDAELR